MLLILYIARLIFVIIYRVLLLPSWLGVLKNDHDQSVTNDALHRSAMVPVWFNILFAQSFLSEKLPWTLWVKFQGLFGSFFLIGIRRNSSKGEGHLWGFYKRCCVFPPAFGCGVHLKDNKNNFWAVLRLDSAFHLLFIFYHLKRRTNVFLLIAWCWSTPIR